MLFFYLAFKADAFYFNYIGIEIRYKLGIAKTNNYYNHPSRHNINLSCFILIKANYKLYKC